MLHNAEVIEAVAASIKQIALVLDPVMVAKGGASLLQDSAVAALKAKLLPLAFIVTPNIPEAEALTGIEINNIVDATKAARALLDMGAKNALVKGGHMDGDEIIDVLVMHNSIIEFRYKRIDTRHTHGTGCTMASAIAANIACGLDVNSAVAAAGRYVQAAIADAPQLGRGHGPLNHRALL
jgi:hydroxymethylpyrimidine/phosphomethylpyrimidine kinase